MSNSGRDDNGNKLARVSLIKSSVSPSSSQRGQRSSQGATRAATDSADLLASEIAPGTMVGDYRVEAKIGEGGMGVVYSATHPVIGKKAAIKVMSASLCVDAASVERFVREARAANHIGHANIVDIFAFGRLTDGRSFFVMEWLQGETLAERLRRGRLDAGESVEILLQVCEALEAAHEQNIVHRDLKPENLFLVRGKRLHVKLLDFGIAKLLGAAPDGGTQTQTQNGVWIGTPMYMSPEQARSQAVDARTDVYALGATAYEMFLGRVPFVAETTIDVIRMHLADAPPRPRDLWSEIPLGLDLLLCQMLEKLPENRPTIQQIMSRLQELRPIFGVQTGPIAIGEEGGLPAPLPPPPVAAPAASGSAPAPVSASSLPSSQPIAPLPGVRSAVAAALPFPDEPKRRGGSALAIAAAIVLLGAGGFFALRNRLRAPLASAPAQPTASTPSANAPPIAPAAAPNATPARVRVQLNVPGRIELDGRVIAGSATAATISVEKPGEHTLIVTAPRRRAYRNVFVTTPGGSVELAVSLERERPAARPAADEPATRPSRDYMLNPFEKK